MAYLLFARLILLITFLQLSVGSLDEFLNYYETLHHESFRHQIKRRDLYTKNPTERIVEFEAHGKHFKLVLHKNTSVLSPDFKVTVVDRREKRSAEIIDTTIYKGYLDDEPTTSSVSAYWDDDQHFTATISTESDTFVFEPSWRHLPDSPEYTLISYKASDMKQNEKSINQFCGVTSHSMDHGKTSDAKETLDGKPQDRTKRNTRDPCPESVKQKKTCQVLLVADYRFNRLIGNGDVAKTTNYMIMILDRVSHLFRRHRFGDCGDGFGFVIKDILVHKDPTSGPTDHYNSQRAWTKSEDLLESFSTYGEKPYSEFCLVHLFTAQSFDSNVLGIAELAQPTAYRSGGLCSGLKKPMRSRNTGWTTFMARNGQRVLYEQAMLVVAHEFGHGWGSGHEFPNTTQKCNPKKDGQFLMFVYAVTGRQRNNDQFSPCSIEAIRNVLVYKADVCFVKPDESRPFCGNYLLDTGEQCDEGPVGRQCCNSLCQLKPGKQCSDLHDPCCENCRIATAGQSCRDPNLKPCLEVPRCDGNSSSCPKPPAKPDGVPCENRGVCINKTCTSICEYNNKTQCACDSEELSCRICCRNSTNENDTCEPYRMLNDTMDYGNVSDNTPCPIGVCYNGVCSKVTDMSLKRSWRFIDIISVAHFVVFMKNNIVGTVIVLSLLVWIPASCTVSYIDRKRAKADQDGINWLRITNTLLIPVCEQNSMKIMKAAGTLDRRQPHKPRYEKGRNNTN